MGFLPAKVSSIRLPALCGREPEMVPEAKRSPVRTDAPFDVRWANCWAIDQYRPRAFISLTSESLMRSWRCRSSARGSFSRK